MIRNFFNFQNKLETLLFIISKILFTPSKFITMKMVIIGAIAVALGVVVASFIQKKLNSTTTA